MTRLQLLRLFPSPPALLTRPLSDPPTDAELAAAWAHVPMGKVEALSRPLPTPRTERERQLLAGRPAQWAARRVLAVRAGR